MIVPAVVSLGVTRETVEAPKLAAVVYVTTGAVVTVTPPEVKLMVSVSDVVDVDASVYYHVYLPAAPETNVGSTKVELRPVIDGVIVWLSSPPPN